MNLRSVNINFRGNTSVFPGATKTSINRDLTAIVEPEQVYRHRESPKRGYEDSYLQSANSPFTPPRRCDSRSAIATSSAACPSSLEHFGEPPFSMAFDDVVNNRQPHPLHPLRQRKRTCRRNTTSRVAHPGSTRINSNFSALLIERIRPRCADDIHLPRCSTTRQCFGDMLGHRYQKQDNRFPIRSFSPAAASSDCISPKTHSHISTCHIAQNINRMAAVM